ncbi:MAG: DNA-binding SARP family transcriptional activator [Candidatus Promineifilaceae bacterium]|jgi:DNA-binding SARP family transcriptional activator
MTSLDLTFLGTFKVTAGGEPVTKFRSDNVRGLLVYLALRGNRPAERDRLATLFWPEESEQIAKRNLRQSIYHLRDSLGDKEASPPYLVVDRRTVALNPQAGVTCDVYRFLEALGHPSAGHPNAGHPNAERDLEAAGALFVGELLPSFECDSPDFETWLRHEREKLNRTALEALGQLADVKLAQVDFSAAKSAALKQLSLEPWREMAHFQLMQALALSGEREAAIAQFDRLEQLLDAELGVSPHQETFDLVRQIENNELGGGLVQSAVQATAQPADVKVPFQAPAVPDYLVGRETEIDEISQLLTGGSDNDRKEIVGLVGMGGIGKTTLAAAVARSLKGQFADGVLWGNTLLSSAENILEVWAQGFGYDFSHISDLESLAIAVRGVLADKKVLIVLDNVTDGLAIDPFLQQGTGCAMLLTTRSQDAAVACGGHIFPVHELSAEGSFALMAQVMAPADISTNADDVAAAKQICTQLEHLPLAVEITAQLLKARPRLTLSGMVERLKSSQQRRGLKISSKAVRASFELSWEFLPPDLRQLFSLIGLFEGRSFSVEALQAIVDSDPFDTEDDLYSLVSRSLVKLDGEDRYKQHPLLADFAAEMVNGEAKEPAQIKLFDYFLDFSKANALNFERLQPEWDNLLAMAHAVSDLGDGEKLLDLTDVLHESWFRYGRYADANEIYALAETAAKQLSSEEGSDERLVQTLIRWSEMGLEQSNYDAVWARLEAALPIAYQLEDDSAVGQVKYLQGYILFDQGEYEAAEKAVEGSIQLFEGQDDLLSLAKAKDLLGWIYFEADEKVDRAINMVKESLNLFNQLEGASEKVSSLRLHSIISFHQKSFIQAEEYAQNAFSLAQKTNSLGEEVASIYALVAIFRGIGNYEQAEKMGAHGINLARQFGMIRFEGMLLQELSAVSLLLGNSNLAREYTKAILKIYERIEDRLGYGYALRQMGDIYKQLGEREKSLQYWAEAKDIANHLKHANLLSQLTERMTEV